MKRLGKLKARRGFSLAECLVALLILSMMSAVACMGVTTALQDRAKAIAVADAQTVAATAAQALGDQIRYGQISDVGEHAIRLTSSTYGSQVTLRLEDGKLVAEDASGKLYHLLGEKAYSGLTIQELTFTHGPDPLDDAVRQVGVTLSVAGESGTLWSLEDYAVAPMNTRLITGP